MSRHWPAASLGALLSFALLRSFVPLPGQPEVAIASLLAMIHVALWMAGRRELERSALVAPLAAIALLAAAQWLLGTTLAPAATVGEAIRWAGLAAVFFLALQVRPMPVREIVAFGGAFAIASAAMHFGTGEAEPAFWLFPNHNHYAAFMELLFPIALYRALASKRISWEAGAALAIFVSVAVCGSRMGAGLMAAEFVAVCLLAGKWDRRLTAVAAVVAMAGVASQWQRYEEILQLKPVAERAANAVTTARMIGARPLAGVGLGAWYAAWPRYIAFDPGYDVAHADNDWLEWTAEGGVLFPLLWVPMLWSAVRGLRAKPWSVGIFAACLHGFAEYPLHKLAVLYWLIALWGLASRGQPSKPD